MTSLHDELEKKLQDSNAAPMCFPLQFLKAITCNFSTQLELGGDGYGVVYKGVLPNGKIIAVKKLFETHLVDDRTFQNAVNSLMVIKHQHVVQFIGYCAESSWETIMTPSGNFILAEMPKRFLCFEYLCNKSLDKYISDESLVLEWNLRYEIIKGICNGLNFLHEECCLVHLDLKPENILLDATMIPKIADFGLSRIFGNQQSRILTNNSVGSRGYMAPEYLIQGIISKKADIFSLGVLIIEIITGHRDYPCLQLDSPQSTATSCQHFTEEVVASWRYKFESTAKYTSVENYNQQLKQCITIALKCVDPRMEKRPTAKDIIEVLNAIDQMEPGILEHIADGRKKPTNLPLELLKSITKNFSEDRVIGQGDFATTYKGLLQNGNVAVKMIRNSHSIDEMLFHREVDRLLGISHQNIVRLLGFCADREFKTIRIKGSREYIFAEVRKKLLCFEYISNGSLENYITDELRGLAWDTRYQIIRGICQGLLYLHKEKCIYHSNLKPSNILLDDHMVPKIMDFGLSRPDENSQTACVGHLRSLYLAPEYLDSHRMSVKSDIYSLGIIIIELVTGEKGIPDTHSVLRRWRHRWNKSGNVTPLAYKQVKKCMEFGLLCREMDPDKRPSIEGLIHDIREMDNVHGTISSASEYIGQISHYSDYQMLGIEPLELHFPFELNKHILSSFELTNETRAYIAFNIRNTSSLKFFIEPNKGIVPPKSKCSIEIILRALGNTPQYMQQTYAFILQSTEVKDGVEAENITADMFRENLHNMVDEVTLDIVLDAQQQEQLLDIHKLKLPFPVEFNNKTPIVLTLEHLKAITGDFSPKSELGRGGYGVVYKGVFVGGEIIAVKKLFDINTLEDDQFQDEVNHLSGIRHKNVVEVLGYCAETSLEQRPQPTGRPIWVEMPKRLICFEYVPNKSLSTYISDESSGLDWKMRYEIIKGICSGLHYLHDDCRIIHLDLKPENILMDAAMVPKVADFGLSKIFTDQQTRLIVTGTRAGSLGYMAPEYNFYGMVSFGADIFSLGVIIIQIITGRREYPHSCSYFKLFNENHSPQSTETSIQEYIDKVVESWRTIFASKREFKSMEKHTEQVKQCITIALSCVDADKEKRPTAKDIIQVLTTIDLGNLSCS